MQFNAIYPSLSPKWLRFISIHVNQMLNVINSSINLMSDYIQWHMTHNCNEQNHFSKDFLTLHCNTYFHYIKRPSQATTAFWHENMLLHIMAARAASMSSQWRARAAESLGQAHVQRLAPSENPKETSCHLATTSFPKIWHLSVNSAKRTPEPAFSKMQALNAALPNPKGPRTFRPMQRRGHCRKRKFQLRMCMTKGYSKKKLHNNQIIITKCAHAALSN